MIAAINGHALGLGLTLALQCDIRFFAADARYGVVQVRRGVVGDAYSHWMLPRLVGIANAAEILLTGATFDGHRAVPLGLGSRVLDADEVLPAALELAPTSPRTPHRCRWRRASGCCGIRSTSTAPPSGHRETDIHLRLMGHDDAKEGVRAYQARRSPEWTGRPRRPDRLDDVDAGGAQRPRRRRPWWSVATPAVRSSSTRVAKPASAASAAVAFTQ